MSRGHEEAVAAVSAAISGGERDLLSAIDAAQEKWQVELDEAKGTARTLLARVLKERESLRTSLVTAAELWGTLRPEETNASRDGGMAKGLSPESRNGFLADEQQMMMVKALRNISHTLIMTEFIVSAPQALDSANEALCRIRKESLDTVVAGNAAVLVEAHSNLTAVERLRDLILLETTPRIDAHPNLSVWFADAAETRELLEEIVIQGVFSDVLHIAQKNPRLLVAAARVVAGEEEEDEWWVGYVQRCGKTKLGASIRPFGAQQYKKKALDAIVKSLRIQFQRKERDLGLHRDKYNGNSEDVRSQERVVSHVRMPNILDWIEHRRTEKVLVRRFVVPCVPPSFHVLELYGKELHCEFMQLVTEVLHLMNPDGSMVLTEPDLIQLISWYSKYMERVGDQNEGIDAFLSDVDRKRLISAVQKHCCARITAKVSSAIAADCATNPAVFKTPEVSESECSNDDDVKKEVTVCRTDLPDVVLGCVNDRIRKILGLKIQGLDQAIAHTAADCLTSFQADVLQIIREEKKKVKDDEQRNLYVCATANNMARCLEYSEDLRELFVPLAKEPGRSNIESRIEDVIEGFRFTSTEALHILIDGMTASLETHLKRFYGPRTGTEIMLDVVATMEDYFSDYEERLLPYHFEYLAIESLKRVVVWYLAPFLRLSQHRLEESAARRFTSLPTFDEMNLLSSSEVPSDDYTDDFGSRRTANDRKERSTKEGLGTLNGTAVVAQIDKDIANLSTFMEKKVLEYQKKQLQPAIEPLHTVRALYTCPPTTFGLSDAFREAKTVIGRALRPKWVSQCAVGGQFNVRIAEVIWESRTDVNPVVLLEAVNMIRMSGERLESASPSRMSSFDDGRMWGSRNSEFGGPFSERLLGKDGGGLCEQAGSSSSLLWTPSVSRSSRSYKRGN